MKKFIMIAVVAVAALSIESHAGIREREKKDLKVRLMPEKMELYERNGNVDFAYKIVVPGRYVKSKHQYVMTPVITNYGEAMTLPSIVINGKKYEKIMAKKRHSAEMKERLKHQPDMSNAIVLSASKNPRIIEYVYAAPFGGWMKDADFILVQRFNSRKNSVLIAEEVYADGVTCTTPPPVKVTQVVNKMEKEIKISFPVNCSKIDMSFDNNVKELYSLKNLIKSILDDKNLVVDSVVIVSSSSPEGPYQFNKNLSIARGNAVKSYLEKEFNVSEQATNKFKTKCIAENWDGMRKLVEGSSMNNKQQILDIFKIKNLEQRDRAMYALAQYPEIKKSILPLLRFVKYEIYYHSVTQVEEEVEIVAVEEVIPVKVKAKAEEIYPTDESVQVGNMRFLREEHYRRTGTMRMKGKSDKVKMKIKPSGNSIHQSRYNR